MSLRYYTCAITLELDSARCLGCGRCVDVCPHDVFALVPPRRPAAGAAGLAHVAHRQAQIVHRDRCMECGACARNCLGGAIRAGSGVGCAAAIINGLIRGSAPECGCGCGENDPQDGSPGPKCGGDN